MCWGAGGYGEGKKKGGRGSDTFLNKLKTKIFQSGITQVDGNEVQVALDSQWVPPIHSFQKYSWHIYCVPSTISLCQHHFCHNGVYSLVEETDAKQVITQGTENCGNHTKCHERQLSSCGNS